MEYIRRMTDNFGWRFCLMLFCAYFGNACVGICMGIASIASLPPL